MLRPPAVAGTFYSSNRNDLAAAVHGYLDEAPALTLTPKALIVPHAGHVYSGPIAATAFRLLVPLAQTISRVVLMGPCHRVAVDGLALSSADRFSTPLGEVDLDTAGAATLAELSCVGYSDAAHAQEHSLEVQLPFLQQTLGPFRLLPIVCGRATTAQVATVLDAVWGGPETLILISSDLSHFHDYETARRMDLQATRAIEELAPEKLADVNACGATPVRGLLQVARNRGLVETTLDVRNSGDTAGAKDRVVGYGAYSFA